jgi:IMP dehydrogenase
MHSRETALSYDDVILIPKYSQIESRFDPDTHGFIKSRQGKEFASFTTPIISANMDTVTEAHMAIEIAKYGAIGSLHRFMSVEEEVRQFKLVKNSNFGAPVDCFVTVGIKDWKERTRALVDVGATMFIVDIAHGHSSLMKDAVMGMRREWGQDILIMAGNVCTGKAVEDLSEWGADIIKAGVGAGAICKTRMVTGHGYPSFSSLLECSQVADKIGVQLIADGGIRTSGDIVKSLVAGADLVMLGSLLAGTDESPGEIVEEAHGKRFKVYRGMASHEARVKSNNNVKAASEGVSSVVPYKGSVRDIIHELTMGIKSGMSYCNASKLSEISAKAEWKMQTYSAYIEGTPHILRSGE